MPICVSFAILHLFSCIIKAPEINLVLYFKLILHSL
nr:MAG TPA: hypothetical protein [Caudoviricetes sp.]